MPPIAGCKLSVSLASSARSATYEDVNAIPRVLCRCKLKFVIDGQRFLIVAN
jgi:hypothetical protein